MHPKSLSLFLLLVGIASVVRANDPPPILITPAEIAANAATVAELEFANAQKAVALADG
jgi:hypothetical protein